MEKSANDEEECGICLDALTNPITLPCSHKFCSGCLNGWRSKYGFMSRENLIGKKCPLCREKIPPSKEMVNQLKFWRDRTSTMEAEGEIYSQRYMTAKSTVEELEHEIGDCTETIDYSDGQCVVLPDYIFKAVATNNIQKVLNWLGPLPIDKERVNAKNQDFADTSLMFAAMMGKNSDLLSILLQLGADVDSVDGMGGIPLRMVASKAGYDAQGRLLLEWGAEMSNTPTMSKAEFIGTTLYSGNHKLANLLKSEFGGRRCEIINLPKRPDLIGKTCVVEKYLPDKDRYKVIFESSKEVGLVGPENLKRRDRTPNDCGYYISYENGRTTRIEFDSKVECQAFVASLSEEGGDRSRDQIDTAAEARAEEAAASLLAELSIESSSTDADRRTKRGKKKGKKNKGRK